MDVEGDAVVDAEHRLDLGRGRREGLVRSRRGEDDQVDLARIHLGMSVISGLGVRASVPLASPPTLRL